MKNKLNLRYHEMAATLTEYALTFKLQLCVCNANGSLNKKS